MRLRPIRTVWILICLILPCWCAAVQSFIPVTADPVAEPWRWRHEEALVGLGVRCMDEAKDGSIWFGTDSGVVRYDGMTVTTLDFDPSLLQRINPFTNRVPDAKALLTLGKDRLLVLLGNTLVLRSEGSWRIIIQQVGPTVFESRMIRGEDGTVWLLVEDFLWRISGDSYSASVLRKAPDAGMFKSFCMDSNQNLWVVEEAGDGRVQLVQIPQGLPDTEVRVFPIPFGKPSPDIQIAAGDDGLIWYADSLQSSGLEAFDPDKGRWILADSSIPLRRFFSVLKGQDGSIWCGGTGSLLHYTKESGYQTYENDRVQLPRVPLALFETQDRRLWVIGRGGYVYSMDTGAREWITYENLGFECETASGVLWFTLDKRKEVVSYDSRSGTWLRYGPDDGLIDEPHSLFYSSHGVVWAIGAHQRRAAVSVFDGVRWVRHLYPEFASYMNPKSGFEAADGTVWFGAGGTMLRDVPGAGGALQFQVQHDRSVRLLKHHAPNALPYYVTAMTQTPDQQIWLGSTIVHRYDGKTPAVPDRALLGENTVKMVRDRNQTVWLAKEHVGVCRRDPEGWTVFGAKEGLSSVLVNDLCLLQDGSLLVSSDQGLSRYDGKTWVAYAYPKWFGMIHPLSGVKQSADGSIWLNYSYNEMWLFGFIGSAGRSKYTIRHRPETNAPDTQIIEYLDHVAPAGNTHISWSGRDLWSRTPAEALQYSWRLNGGEWSAFSYEAGKTFVNLDSGHHVLEVRARDLAFNIDPSSARAEFSVMPPIWKQAWFVTLISVLIGFIVFLLWLLIRNREQHLLEKQAEHEEFLVKQQAEHERNLIERQAERESLLVKQQEERERHLKELDRVKTGFFTNISHELRTPMTVINGWLEVIFNSNPDEKTKKALSIVLRNTQRVTTLITQLLDFRKIQEGKIRVEPTHGDLMPPLRDWVASLQVLAEQAGLSLSLDAPESVHGNFDFDKVQKIVTNLVANAIKYTNSGGNVRVILTKPVECNAEQSVIFTVEDTGVGIPPEHIGLIFERFYRVSEASMAVGAGIGLNLTKELVELLGGTIQIESPIHPDPERPGSRFTIRVPLEQTASGERQESAASDPSDQTVLSDPADRLNPPSSGEAPLILVVEDDEDIRSFILEGLTPVYRVETADNGEAGLQKAKELVPDLMITDLMMPVMDGMALSRQLKTSLETSHIPIVMLTAKSALESQLEGLKAGVDDYITKPFHMELLLARVENLLQSRRLLRQAFCNEYPVLKPNLPEHAPDKAFLEKVLGVLEENYSEWSFNPDELAAALNMSVRSLQRKLKAVMDQAPSEVINDFRLMKAAEMLSNTSETVAEVMFRVGYDEPSNFNRLFKKRYQMSPTQYRAAQRPS